MTHTFAMVRDPCDYDPYKEQPIGEIIKSGYSLPLSFPPGEKWLHSNLGYYVQVITKASGKPWNEFIVERLFAPARMTSTRTTTATDIVPHRASGYQLTGPGMINAENWIAVRPSGAFCPHYWIWRNGMPGWIQPNVLSASSRKLMWTRARLKDTTPVNYGFGWSLDSFLCHPRIHHDGQFPVFRADYERFADDKLTVIVRR